MFISTEKFVVTAKRDWPDFMKEDGIDDMGRSIVHVTGYVREAVHSLEWFGIDIIEENDLVKSFHVDNLTKIEYAEEIVDKYMELLSEVEFNDFKITEEIRNKYSEEVIDYFERFIDGGDDSVYDYHGSYPSFIFNVLKTIVRDSMNEEKIWNFQIGFINVSEEEIFKIVHHTNRMFEKAIKNGIIEESVKLFFRPLNGWFDLEFDVSITGGGCQHMVNWLNEELPKLTDDVEVVHAECDGIKIS